MRKEDVPADAEDWNGVPNKLEEHFSEISLERVINDNHLHERRLVLNPGIRHHVVMKSNGQVVRKKLWKDINARDCLTKYESMDPYGNRLELREIVGKELQMQQIMDKNKCLLKLM